MILLPLIALLVPVLAGPPNLRKKIDAIIVDRITGNPPPPPPWQDVARMARYIVHYSDWAALSHISHQGNLTGYPEGRIYSMSDGPLQKSTGIPYLYVSFLDGVPRDLKGDSKCSLALTLAQNGFCASQNLDAEDPRCPQVILTGDFVIINNNTRELNTAREALFSRHPEMKYWPKSHNFFFAKLDIKNIKVVDFFGGAKHPSIKDYFNSPPPIQYEVKQVYFM